jgi:hypothetical protein
LFCAIGNRFFKSINAFAYVKDALLLCESVDGFVPERGSQYVVQVIMNNVVNYIVARKLLKERYWTYIGLLVPPIALIWC